MNDDLLRELAEIKNDIKGLNERLDKVTDKVIASMRDEAIDNKEISLEKALKETEEVMNSKDNIGVEHQFESPMDFQPIAQPMPTPIVEQSMFTPLPTKESKFSKPNFNRVKKPKIDNYNQGDLETNIGKNVMGILASLLIFIGIASFVIFVFQDMSEILKFALMYLFSFGLLGLGLWRVEKNKNGFSLSLSGCGIGAVFISILLSCFYFEYITNEFLLFGLLVGWSAIVLLLSKRYESNIFVIISYIGFYIALLLGAASGMEIVGDTICTVSLMIILHSLFTLLISSEKISISDGFYKVFPFISLLGSFILILFVFSEDTFIYYPVQIECILPILAMLIQMIVNLGYIHNLKKSNIAQSLITVLLLCTCIINILGFTSTAQNYYYNSYPEDDGKPFFSFLFEKEEDIELEDNDVIYYEDKDLLVESIPCVEVQNDSFIGLSMLFAVIVQLVFIELSHRKLNGYRTLRYVGLYSLVIFGSLVLIIDNVFSVLVSILGLIVPAILLLIYGKKDYQIFKMSLIVYFLGLFAGCIHNDIWHLEDFFVYYCIFSVLHLGYLVISGLILKQNYKLSNKALYYIVSILGILFITNIFGDYFSNVLADKYYNYLEVMEQGHVYIQAPEEIHRNPIYLFLEYDLALIIVFIVMTLSGLFVKLSSFCQNWNRVDSLMKSDEENLDFVYNLNNGLNCILLIMGVSLIHEVEIGWIQFILILLSSLLCFIGSRELLSRDKRILEYYVGIKATLFINTVMGAFVDSELGYIYSIVCLLIAVASIIIGFREELKSFRLYGLILSIFSVLKLVMIDISYDNSLGRIFSFIASGLLCFLIVWIYNRMSERLKE